MISNQKVIVETIAPCLLRTCVVDNACAQQRESNSFRTKRNFIYLKYKTLFKKLEVTSVLPSKWKGLFYTSFRKLFYFHLRIRSAKVWKWGLDLLEIAGMKEKAWYETFLTWFHIRRQTDAGQWSWGRRLLGFLFEMFGTGRELLSQLP